MAVLLGTLGVIPTARGEPAANASAQQDGSVVDVVAAAVRITGTPCENPRDVEQDAAASRPDRPAWFIRCEQGLYQVPIEGDTGPRVTPLGR